MRARLTKLGAAVVALAALAVGGSALASAAQHKGAKPVVRAHHVAQTTPDTTPTPAENGGGDSQAGAPDGDNVQQGDQTGNDQSATDQSGEQSSSETGASDGPGGYADTSPNADTQQEGEH